jgi:hypothetical protein
MKWQFSGSMSAIEKWGPNFMSEAETSETTLLAWHRLEMDCFLFSPSVATSHRPCLVISDCSWHWIRESLNALIRHL